ncbi:MAG TPA: hypothetical protein VMJ10_13845 [Kofleriaceae bacterium]|nr:hypothetical protein [Kofleriaceae bacterium]
MPSLPLALRDSYLVDLLAWVAARCRDAIVRGMFAKPARALLDDAVAGLGPSCGLARWETLGPHAALRRELGLTLAATALLVVAAAPRLWSTIAIVYRMAGARGPALDRKLAVALLGGDREAEAAVALELASDAPLVRSGALVVRGESIAASDAIVRRLAGMPA